MSDGTLKVFAYLLLLEDPRPPPFICMEEPENGLYHKLWDVLAVEFRKYTAHDKNKVQLFITTHQPYFVSALSPDEVWVLKKGANGFSEISRASANDEIVALVGEEFPLGELWHGEYLED